MGFSKKFIGVLAAACVIPAMPASANQIESDIQVRKLDMMLMATSLRCRFGADNFQADYDNVRKRHRHNLKAANERVLRDMTRRMGRKNAINAYDRMSTGMANEYGTGHPWLDCAQLKAQTKALASRTDRAALDDAAGELLRKRPSSRLALAE